MYARPDRSPPGSSRPRAAARAGGEGVRGGGARAAGGEGVRAGAGGAGGCRRSASCSDCSSQACRGSTEIAYLIHMRRTKIIATLGPASASDTRIRELIAAGVDVFRFNFSHGTHDSHAEVIERVPGAAKDSGRIIALLQDLSGPKIRTGKLRGGGPVTLKDGETLSIVVGEFDGD